MSDDTVEVAKLAKIIGTMNAISLHQTDRPKRDLIPGIRAINHELTCGNDSGHTPLFPYYETETNRVVLICRDCDYTQTAIPSALVKS